MKENKLFSPVVQVLSLALVLWLLGSGLTAGLASAALPAAPVLDYPVNKTFNGTADFTDLTSDISRVSGLAQGSIAAKVRTSSGAAVKTIFSLSDTKDPSSNMSLTINGGSLYFENRENGVYATKLNAPASSVINDGNWHTVVLTVGSGGTAMYIDGALSVTDASTSFFPNVKTPDGMWIGRNGDNGGGQWYYAGDIALVQLYDKALSADEALAVSTDRALAQNAMTASASSFQTGNEPVKALDGNTGTMWHTLWSGTDTTRELTLNLGGVYSLSKLTYLPRQDSSANGTITSYEIYTSADGTAFTKSVSGTWANDKTLKAAVVAANGVRYVKLKALAGTGGFASAAEIGVYVPGGDGTPPSPGGLSAKATKSSEIYVSWNDSAGATGYDLEADGTVISGVTSPYLHTGLAAGSTHTYKIRGRNSRGTGEWSAPVSAATLTGNAFKTVPTALFGPNMFGSAGYRIPSLFTTSKGTLIAGIDQRIPGNADSPNDINFAIRRSTDGGQTWNSIQVLIDYPGSGYNGASVIDSELMQDPATGTLFALVDHFPGGYGFGQAKAGTGFDANGNKILTDNSGAAYTLRAGGAVYNSAGAVTTYTVRDNGDVYNGATYAGNIYLKTGIAPESLHEYGTSYLQIIQSTDDGLTWSAPVDLNAQVKADWMKFMGTGPGNGIAIGSGPYAGRLVFPVYYTNTGGYQSSAVIYSDDHGKTWKRGESPNDGRVVNGAVLNSQTLNVSTAQLTEDAVIEVTGGGLKMFMRNTSAQKRVAVATSSDGGATWDDNVTFDSALPEPYCQLSAVNFPDLGDGKRRVLFSNPASTGSRTNGTVRLSEDGSSTWAYSKVITPGSYSYSSLTVLPDKSIGLLYEGESGEILFTRFNLDWIKTP
ncbi:exo-alpha-sialidase [Paenibacillus sp. FJAT-26967]|uniref:exo-alpha-sialidase n=1 Tax=Paenibacillus sp. FJAT-26967 TaxID=1729690 RepID=UPI000837C965|nr:exo-alpha-sialidase [Paenibacillus sp. FJAT-26967]